MRRPSADKSLAFVVCSIALVALLGACSSDAGETGTPPEPQAAAPQEAAAPPAAADLLRNGVMVSEGILAGGQPTEEQFAGLAEAGYKTVINMRLPDEQGNIQGEAVEAAGMNYVTVPIEGAAGLSEERARAFAEALDAAERPTVVHCGSGNRVGALFALKAFYVDGATTDEAIQFGLDAGMTRLEGPVREHLAAAEQQSD